MDYRDTAQRSAHLQGIRHGILNSVCMRLLAVDGKCNLEPATSM
jgi:hypothetical protein